jgi:hypothetical protein
MALAIGAGINLPSIWCDRLLGRPVHRVDARVGVRFRSEEDDLRALRSLAKGRRIGPVLSGLLPHRHTAHALFAVRDPVPLAHEMRTLLR